MKAAAPAIQSMIAIRWVKLASSFLYSGLPFTSRSAFFPKTPSLASASAWVSPELVVCRDE